MAVFTVSFRNSRLHHRGVPWSFLWKEMTECRCLRSSFRGCFSAPNRAQASCSGESKLWEQRGKHVGSTTVDAKIMLMLWPRIHTPRSTLKKSAYVQPSTWARILTTATFIQSNRKHQSPFSDSIISFCSLRQWNPWLSPGSRHGWTVLVFDRLSFTQTFSQCCLNWKVKRNLKRTQVSLRYCKTVLSKFPPPWAHICWGPGGGHTPWAGR